MKKTALLLLLSAAIGVTVCKANVAKPLMNYRQPAADTLSIYTGKFQKLINNNMFYLQFDLVEGNLIGSTLWDGNKMMLKHLSGDNFIVLGIDWGVKFIRDKDGKVNSVIVRGADVWTKVKN